MSTFHARMESFTKDLAASVRHREEALTQVRADTEELLDNTRGFLGAVSRDLRATADELHASLAADRASRSERVLSMRNDHKESLRRMRNELQDTLSESNRARREAVSELNDGFHKAQRELANDLRAASQAWHKFAASR